MSFYPVREDQGGPGSAWFGQSIVPRKLSEHEITRARLYCADQAADADELREFLDMLGIGA